MGYQIRVWEVVLAAVSVAGVVSGCSTSTPAGPVEIAKDKLQHQVLVQWAEQGPGMPPETIDCDGPLHGEIGATQHCIADANGSRYAVTATVTKVEGRDVSFNFRVDGQLPPK